MGLRVTKKPWFGPKRLVGWGWSIASWEGGLVTAVFVAAIIAATAVWHRVPVAIVIFVVYLVTVVLTGDPPGGPRPR